MNSIENFKLIVLAASLATVSCGGGGSDGGFNFPPASSQPASSQPASSQPASSQPAALPDESMLPEETRVQDARRSFAPIDPNATTFEALKTDSSDTVDNTTTSRWAGMLNGAQYYIEVPKNWNRKLVMYAHGYAGEDDTLTVSPPPIRRHLIQNGYAWAASSYSKNFFDARAGLEDTNALAAAFIDIAKAKDPALPLPERTFVVGQSMGGLISAAAVERETQNTANHKFAYNGAMSMCGVVADTELFDYYGALQVTAQALADQANYPIDYWTDISDLVTRRLFSSFKPKIPAGDFLQILKVANSTSGRHSIDELPQQIVPSQTGTLYRSVIKNLTGGDRPMFDIGFQVGGSLNSTLGLFGAHSGTVNGILNKNVVDTQRFTYVIDDDATASETLNKSALKLIAAPDANRLRRDGLRWIPKANGEFTVPMITLHTLGDLRVPFSMEQIYQKRAADHGNANRLVQRAIRGVTHCDFTINEQVEAFDALVNWESTGIKPAGDDVTTAEVVAKSDYGCAFSRPPTAVDDSPTVKAARQAVANVAPCPGQ